MRQAYLWNYKLRILTGCALFLGGALITAGKGRPDFVETGYKLPGTNRPEHARGPKIVEKLADRLHHVAMKHGLSEEEFIAWVSSDNSVHMDELDDLEDIYFGKRKIKDEMERYKLTGIYEYSHMLKPPKDDSRIIPSQIPSVQNSSFPSIKTAIQRKRACRFSM